MTTPLPLPPPLARQILDLPAICEHAISALRERGLRGDATTLASLEQLAALIISGGDATALVARLGAARRDLAALMLAGEEA